MAPPHAQCERWAVPNDKSTATGLEDYDVHDKSVMLGGANQSLYLARRYRRGRMNGIKNRLPLKVWLNGDAGCGVRGKRRSTSSIPDEIWGKNAMSFLEAAPNNTTATFCWVFGSYDHESPLNPLQRSRECGIETNIGAKLVPS